MAQAFSAALILGCKDVAKTLTGIQSRRVTSGWLGSPSWEGGGGLAKEDDVVGWDLRPGGGGGVALQRGRRS